jgi:hypothetical protein
MMTEYESHVMMSWAVAVVVLSVAEVDQAVVFVVFRLVLNLETGTTTQYQLFESSYAHSIDIRYS